jgi:hypothetical protein
LFILASNSALSNYGSNAYTDDRYLEWNPDGSFYNEINSATGGWNKPSDILVKVYDSNGNLLTDRNLPTNITSENLTRWAPYESIYVNEALASQGLVTTPRVARFKGDDFVVPSNY